MPVLSRFAVFVQEFERRDAAEIAILLASVTSSHFFGEGAVALLSLVRESVKRYLLYLLLILESSFPGRRREAILPFPHAINFLDKRHQIRGRIFATLQTI